MFENAVRYLLGGISAFIIILLSLSLFTHPVSVATENPSFISGFVIVFLIFIFIVAIYGSFKKEDG